MFCKYPKGKDWAEGVDGSSCQVSNSCSLQRNLTTLPLLLVRVYLWLIMSQAESVVDNCAHEFQSFPSEKRSKYNCNIDTKKVNNHIYVMECYLNFEHIFID